jgi:dihydroorotate dehydrogenase
LGGHTLDMSFYGSVIRPLAFLFDPEWVHEQAMGLIARGIFRGPLVEDHRLEQTLFGVKFANPLGLAAGFDKNAVALDHWHKLGFGHVEVGTVTQLAQPGNPRPRLFRVPEAQALINRLGFNNDGAHAVAERFIEAHPHLPVGVNLGKSRVVPLEEAVADYAASFRILGQRGAWVTVNVSSPNTPGLRSLQEKGPLTELLTALRELGPEIPLFVKVAPDLELTALDEVLDVAVTAGLTGIVATNTTLSRDGIALNEQGGVSGGPLRSKANDCLAHIARAKTNLTLIGVGGVFGADDLYEKIALGAHLVQVYTGWIYTGPTMVGESLGGLLMRMDQEGIKSLGQLRGSKL